jgi:hypothetical protein
MNNKKKGYDNMSEYTNKLLQNKLESNNDYCNLATNTNDAILNNNNIPNTYVIDLIQMMIMRATNTFLLYIDCEELFFTIKKQLLKEGES